MKLSIVFILAFFMSACYDVERNCKSFKNGDFTIEMMIDNQVEKSEIKRFNNSEIEFFRKKTDTSTVKWINECEYILSSISETNKKPIHIKITSTFKNGYNFEFGLVGQTSNKYKGKAYFIKAK